MKKRWLILAAVWLASVILYVALSFVIARAFSFTMMRWAYGDRPAWFVKYETARLLRTIATVCIFWGALYASALAKPASFGRTARILKHLASTYVLGLTGCFLAAVIIYLPFPNFDSSLALSVYPGVILILSVLCFVLGITVWVRLAFGGKATTPDEIVSTAELKS